MNAADRREVRAIEDGYVRRLRVMTVPEVRASLQRLVQLAAIHGGERMLWWAQGDGATTVNIHPAAERYCAAFRFGWLTDETDGAQ